MKQDLWFYDATSQVIILTRCWPKRRNQHESSYRGFRWNYDLVILISHHAKYARAQQTSYESTRTIWRDFRRNISVTNWGQLARTDLKKTKHDFFLLYLFFKTIFYFIFPWCSWIRFTNKTYHILFRGIISYCYIRLNVCLAVRN